MKKITVQREQLYKEAWSTPLSKLAPKYQISDVGLKKICKKLNIPTPPRGYWAKVQHGKKVKRSPLPDPTENQQLSWTFRIHPARNRKKKKKPIKKKKTQIDLGFDVKVPQRLHSPHHLIQNTRKQLLKEKPDHLARVRCEYCENCLDVYVGPDSIKRAMRILNAVLKAFNKLGYRIITKKAEFPRSFVLIDGQEIQFCIREKGYREKHIPTEEEKNSRRHETWDYFTTGKLWLELNGWGNSLFDQKKWSDKKKRPLEEQLNAFVAGVIRAAQALKEDEKRREEERIKEREKQRKLDESRRQRNEELERLSLLEERAEHFTKSQYIYDFISEIEELESKLDLTEKERLKLKGWLHWATLHADRLNPVKQTLKSIITDS